MEFREESIVRRVHDYISAEDALGRWRLLLKRLPLDEGGGWYARFPAFGPAAAHGDAVTIAGAIADATVSLNLVVDALTGRGEPLPADDVR